jgi:hypothetical protein
VKNKKDIRLATMTGFLVFNKYELCSGCYEKPCVNACKEFGTDIIRFKFDIPELSITESKLKKGGCSECLACEFVCKNEGKGVIAIELPLEEVSIVDKRNNV